MVPNDPTVSIQKGPADYQSEDEIQRCVNQALDRLNLPVDFIVPGEKVVLKPNWVKEHDERFPGENQWEHVVTHPSVIEAVICWVAERLQTSGEIICCDAPQTDSSFSCIRNYCRLDKMIDRCRDRYPKLRIELLDLRPEEWKAVDGVTVNKTVLPGDPKGATHVRLNECSEFLGYPGLGQLYGASYNMDETNERHRGSRHEYMLCSTPMSADVLINLPKLKCHKKVGVTCALKNLVGINANKNWLPHHTEGTPDKGGDQFPKGTAKARLEHSIMGSLKRRLFGRHFLSRVFIPLKQVGRLIFGDTQKVVRSGNWHGNDTCWRMVLDLNKCLFYFGGDGKARKRPLKYLAVVDGVIGGEGNGPMAPDPRPCGVIVAGESPVAVDVVSAAIMGFDPLKLRMLGGAFKIDLKPLTHFCYEDIRVVSNEEQFSGLVSKFDPGKSFRYRPHFGWVGGIEYDELLKTQD